MTFQEITAQMGIETYPEEMDAIFAKKPAFCITEQMLEHWQTERNLFGEFYDDVRNGYRNLLTKPVELAWTSVACQYLLSATCAQARALKLPASDGSPARDMMPLFLLLSRVEWAMAEYIRRGFTETQVRELMDVFKNDFRSNIRQCGRAGVNQGYYNWSVLFMYCVLLPCRGFKFDIRKNPNCTTLLRNKENNQFAVLVHDVRIHKSGHRLGTAGYEEEDGAFTPTLDETDTAWHGYPANKMGLVFPQKQVFSKLQWDVVAKPGDNILGLHIPRGMDIRPESVRYAVEGVTEHIRKYYPEYDIKAIHCTSWMLNPELGDIIGAQSNLAVFSNLFCRYPTVSNGKAVFGFVFGKGSNTDLAALPEDTRLQRAFKQRYLQGSYIHVFGGYYL